MLVKIDPEGPSKLKQTSQAAFAASSFSSWLNISDSMSGDMFFAHLNFIGWPPNIEKGPPPSLQNRRCVVMLCARLLVPARGARRQERSGPGPGASSRKLQSEN